MTKPLASRIALVTGASRGIGYATAVALAKAGAHVVAVARTQGGLEELDDAIRAAMSKHTSRSSDSGTVRDTNPLRSASSAVTSRPVSIISKAREVPIARGVVARHLRFVSHEGPLGLSQVVLNREGPNRHLLLPAEVGAGDPHARALERELGAPAPPVHGHVHRLRRRRRGRARVAPEAGRRCSASFRTVSRESWIAELSA